MSNINDLIIFELNNAEQVLSKTDKFTSQNVQNVLNNGGYRDIKQYTKGLNTGSKNLQKKYGIKEKIILNPFSTQGAYTDADNRTIHIPFPFWNMSRVADYSENNPNATLWNKFKSGFDPTGAATALDRRHETDEARIGQQIADRNGVTGYNTGIKFMSNVPLDDQTSKSINNSFTGNPDVNATYIDHMGTHNSPMVLQNEKPYAQYMSNFTDKLNDLITYRNNSGEYGSSVQDLTPKQIRQIEDQSVQNNQTHFHNVYDLVQSQKETQQANREELLKNIKRHPLSAISQFLQNVKSNQNLDSQINDEIMKSGVLNAAHYIMSPHVIGMPVTTIPTSFGPELSVTNHIPNPNAILDYSKIFRK